MDALLLIGGMLVAWCWLFKWVCRFCGWLMFGGSPGRKWPRC